MESSDNPRPATRPDRRIDIGRVVAVSLFVLLMILNAGALFGDLDSLSQDPLEFVAGLLVMAFYGLLTVAYLRRSPSQRTDRHWWAWLVAFLGTGAPFAIPLVSDGPRAGVLAVLGVVVLITGLVMMLWALGALGTNISVVPQAREAVTHGPYARVRHPLYAAELVNVVGLCLLATGPWQWLVFAALVSLQVLRARREEALLSRELPGYAEYKSRTPMLVPTVGRS